MVVVIFAYDSGNVPFEVANGFDRVVDLIDLDGNVIDDPLEAERLFQDPAIQAANMGSGKAFPGGPTCHFRGKDVPCFVAANAHGGIDETILTGILRRMDSLGVLRRQGEPNPFLLVDGHGSRFTVEFLGYVVDPEHEWTATIGLPNGTQLWQVGDSKEQNGTLKSSLRKEAEYLTKVQIERDMPIRLDNSDLMPIISKAIAQSFANEETNKKAIAARGLNPCNRQLLVSPELMRAREETTTPVRQEEFASIPDAAKVLSPKGVSKKYLHHLVHMIDKQEAQTTIEKNKQKARAGQTAFGTVRKVLAGSLWSAGGCVLDKPLFEQAKRYQDRQAYLDENKQKKRYDAADKQVAFMEELIKIKPPETTPATQYTNDELNRLIVFTKRNKQDGAVAKKKDDKIQQWNERKDRFAACLALAREKQCKEKSLIVEEEVDVAALSLNGSNLLETVRVGIEFEIDDTVNGIIREFGKPEIVIVGSWPVQCLSNAVEDKHKEKKKECPSSFATFGEVAGPFPKDLTANDIDVFFGEVKEGPFKMLGFPEVHDCNGDKVNLIHVENLSHEMLLENNDVNATSFAIRCTAMIPDPNDDNKEIVWEPPVHGHEVDINIRYEFHTTDHFWKWWYDKRHVLQACDPQKCKSKTFVRLAYKSFQHGWPFLDGGIDPGSELLPKSQAAKVREMIPTWPNDESPFQHLRLKRIGGAWKLSTSGNRQAGFIWWPPVIMRDRSIGTKATVSEQCDDGSANDDNAAEQDTNEAPSNANDDNANEQDTNEAPSSIEEI
jgi:hypothetical protein